MNSNLNQANKKSNFSNQTRKKSNLTRTCHESRRLELPFTAQFRPHEGKPMAEGTYHVRPQNIVLSTRDNMRVDKKRLMSPQNRISIVVALNLF
jgi:hypothetical protein